MRILLVEDERKVASFIARALRENTYAVDVAESGQKALELGADVPYDAILLDVRLPDLSGIEVCRELRQRGIESPVMMLTAPSLLFWRNSSRESGHWCAGAFTAATQGFAMQISRSTVTAGAPRATKRPFH